VTPSAMIIVPDTPAAVEGLNSYYLRLDRLLEHFQHELEAGALHLRAPAAECVVYFDETGPVGGTYRDDTDEVSGSGTFDHLLRAAPRHNFRVAVHPVAPDRVHYWAAIPHAEVVHRDLSAEFTDLDGLIRKMQAERLSGYIEVAAGGGQTPAQLFFAQGRFLGGRYPWREAAKLDRRRESVLELRTRVRRDGGVFTVRRIAPERAAPAAGTADTAEEAREVLEALRGLLTIAENTVRADRRGRVDFVTRLKKKFVQRADRWEFLDPFTAEFAYADGRIAFHGDAPPERLARGVAACVAEVAADLKLEEALATNLRPWRERHAAALERWQVRI